MRPRRRAQSDVRFSDGELKERRVVVFISTAGGLYCPVSGWSIGVPTPGDVWLQGESGEVDLVEHR